MIARGDNDEEKDGGGYGRPPRTTRRLVERASLKYSEIDQQGLRTPHHEMLQDVPYPTGGFARRQLWR